MTAAIQRDIQEAQAKRQRWIMSQRGGVEVGVLGGGLYFMRNAINKLGGENPFSHRLKQ